MVSLEVPRSYDELLAALHKFIAFAFTFAALVWIWYLHYQFFRRYHLSDGPTIVLNAILLFVVLLYVYPLKFLSTYVVDAVLDPAAAASIQPWQSVDLLVIYDIGYVAVFTVFLLMHVYTYAKRRELSLSRLELFDTRYAIQNNIINLATGLASMPVAVMGGPSATAFAGILYALVLAPARTIHGFWSGKRRRPLERAQRAGS
ncbi:MAG: hypothetical protein AUH85_06995 [Chloroflexi bacterium 13_1_40CM_4_68_4]|nr:MAG: hypothetical protein AUH85_06995 [Chloroflexi bacterium 13_1_40CM_4_68_4]